MHPHQSKSLSVIIRSILFNIFFFFGTVILCLIFWPILLLPKFVMVRVNYSYLWIIAWLERHVLKLNYDLTGQENLPAVPYIVAMQHQSAWETFKLGLWFPNPVIILKQELTWIPIWGWFAVKMGVIPLNRQGGIKALNLMVRTAKNRVEENRPIVIFPQGTRSGPGEKTPYRIGIGKLYEALNLPVVPVQLNSGAYWPKRSFWKKPGIIQVKINPAIMPGLKIKDFMSVLESTLEN